MNTKEKVVAVLGDLNCLAVQLSAVLYVAEHDHGGEHTRCDLCSDVRHARWVLNQIRSRYALLGHDAFRPEFEALAMEIK